MISDVLSESIGEIDGYLAGRMYTGKEREVIVQLREYMRGVLHMLDAAPSIARMNKISAIKMVRERTSLGLAEAKALVETLFGEVPAARPSAVTSKPSQCVVINLYAEGKAINAAIEALGRVRRKGVGDAVLRIQDLSEGRPFRVLSRHAETLRAVGFDVQEVA